MISASIIADSLSPGGVRLTTFVLVYPRFIHSEFLTHRVFSRNAASSRAIPVKKMLAYIRSNPALPVSWGKNQSGMQANEELDPFTQERAKEKWLEACSDAVRHSEDLMNLGVHKQVANRITEPFVHMNTICTATEWENFFNLRRHKAAQPEIKVLADEMWKAYQESKPRSLFGEEWHLPFILKEEWNNPIDLLKKCSVARCCRVSYMNHDGTKPDAVKDVILHDTLIASGHMSPLEHIATPAPAAVVWYGNFRGWKSYRKFISNEDVFRG